MVVYCKNNSNYVQYFQYYQYIICMIISISQVSRWQLDSHETSDSLPSRATLQLEYWVQALVRTAQCITWNHYNTYLSIKTFLLCPILCMLRKEKFGYLIKMPYTYLLENILYFSVHSVTDKNQFKTQNSWFRIPLTSLSVQHCGLSVHKWNS